VLPVLWIAIHAFVAYDALMNIQGDVHSAQRSVATDQFQALPYIYSDMKGNAATAASATADPLWTAAGYIPVIGPNLRAVSGVSATIDELVVNGVGPIADAAKDFSIGEFRPEHGQVDMAKVESFVPAVNKAYDGIIGAQQTGNAIDTTHTLGAVTAAVQSFRVVIETGVLDLASARKIIRLVPPALGSSGAQNYLVVLGTNGVDRANGGALAAASLVTIDDGRVTVARTVPASALGGTPASTSRRLATMPPFASTASASVADAERTPDYPATAANIAAAWTAKYGDRVDDVVSLDTTGLGYLAKAAGRVPIGGGKTVSATSIARYLQTGATASGLSSKAVAKQQVAALSGTLQNVIDGKGETAAYVTTASQFLFEKRLLVWSSVTPLQKFLATTPFAGILSDSNAAVTTYGVFVNADSAVATSPTLKMRVLLTPVACTVPASTTSDLKITLASTATTSALTQDVLVYGPVDFTAGHYSITGGTVTSSTARTIHGRPVSAFRVRVAAGATAVLEVRHEEGGAAPSKTVEVRSTPRWRVTAVRFASCTP
jgi:hypothetical protein